MPSEQKDPGYEPPDPERPATALPTEPELEREAAHPARPPGLDYHAEGKHDPYAALRSPAYRRYSAGWMTAVVGQTGTGR